MISAINDVRAWYESHLRSDSARWLSGMNIGSEEYPKQAISVGFQSDSRLGVVSVWSSGEVEAEVVVVETLERPLIVSTRVESTGALYAVLDRTLSEVRQGASGPDQ
jgi:hypothetical protein